MDSSEFVAHAILKVMEDDPSKIIQVRELSERMPHDENETIQEIMAEEAIHQMSVNMGHFPEMQTMDRSRVEQILTSEFTKRGWNMSDIGNDRINRITDLVHEHYEDGSGKIIGMDVVHIKDDLVFISQLVVSYPMQNIIHTETVKVEYKPLQSTNGHLMEFTLLSENDVTL